jgi:hypothetical protein
MHACSHVCPGLTATRDWRPGREMDCRDMGYGFGDLLKVDEYICPARRQPSACMRTEPARVRARASATALTDRQILSLSHTHRRSHLHTHTHTVDAVKQQMAPIRNEEHARDDDACRRPPPPLLGLSQTHNILVSFATLWHSNCSPAQAPRNRPLCPQQTIASPRRSPRTPPAAAAQQHTLAGAPLASWWRCGNSHPHAQFSTVYDNRHRSNTTTAILDKYNRCGAAVINTPSRTAL